MDFQSSAKSHKHLDILVYNTLLHRHHRVPVHSIVVLLGPQAAHSNLNGAVSYATRDQRGKIEFRYEVVRLWEWSAAELRVSVDTAKNLFRGVGAMEDSSTFVAIIDEGREKQAKRTIFRLGEKRFGSPDESTKAKLAAISDIDRLEEITDRIFEVSSWRELF